MCLLEIAITMYQLPRVSREVPGLSPAGLGKVKPPHEAYVSVLNGEKFILLIHVSSLSLLFGREEKGSGWDRKKDANFLIRWYRKIKKSPQQFQISEAPE